MNCLQPFAGHVDGCSESEESEDLMGDLASNDNADSSSEEEIELVEVRSPRARTCTWQV